jgi:predicted nucleic acid-binding protein
VASPSGPAFAPPDIVLGAHTLVLSRAILDEVERVLLYPRLQARNQITAAEVARFTGNLADAADMVEPVIVRPIVLSDPSDDSVLYTAADGKADVLCTRNIRHFSAANVQDFCALRGIRVMTDLDVLHTVSCCSALQALRSIVAQSPRFGALVVVRSSFVVGGLRHSGAGPSFDSSIVGCQVGQGGGHESRAPPGSTVAPAMNYP